MAAGRTHTQEGTVAAFTPFANNHAALAPGDSRFVDVAELPWQKARFPGVEFKTLLVDEATGLLTTLMRMAPGASLPDHEHVRIEQTYVLEGRLVDDDGEVSAGNFVWRPAGSRHDAHAPDGALLIAVFIKPNRFFEADGSTMDMLGRDYASTWE